MNSHNLNEYYIVANSFAAPFVSDTQKKFVVANNAKEALLFFMEDYKHPAGLYCAWAYRDANAEAKELRPLAKWHSNALIWQGKYIPDGINLKEGSFINE